jgi:tetratricopeptide (TPR) repeat protein
MHRDAIASRLQYRIGLTYQRQGMLHKALDIFQELDLKNAEKGITDTDMLRNVSKIYDDLGQNDDVLAVSMEILQTEKDDKETLVKVIHLLKKRGQTDELIDYLRRLHKLYPNSNNFTMAYANALMENNEIPKAEKLYSQIIEKYEDTNVDDDDEKYASLKLAECMFKLGEKKPAYEMFLALVKDDTKFKDAWAGLAKAATELEKTSEAKRAIEKVANLEKYEISRDTIESEYIGETPLISTPSSKQSPERTLSKGQNVIQKPTFKYNPKTRMADNGVEKTFVDNIDSLLNGHGGALQIGFTDGKPTGLFSDLKLLPKKKRNHDEFEKKLRETLQNRLSVSDILRDIRITFPKTHSVYVCEMFIPKSSIPVYVITKNKDEEFYVRQKKELVRLSPREQKEYIDDNFGDIE